MIIGLGLQAPDPYQLDDTLAAVVSSPNILTARSSAINPALKTLVLICIGQSNLCNVVTTLFTPVNNLVVDNFSIYDGACYNIGGPMLGCTSGTPGGSLGPGNICARVADKFVTNAIFDRVIVLPIGVGGSTMAHWAAGPLSAPGTGGRLGVAMRRLAARGITPATTGVTFANLVGLGETDNNPLGTSQASWTASFGTYLANCLSAGFSGRTFVCQETYYSGATSAAVRAAQAAVVSGSVFSGGDLDTLTNGGGYRQADDVHFNDAGAAAGATLIYNAMHLSGAPF